MSDQTTGTPVTWPGSSWGGLNVLVSVGFGNFPPGFVPINGSASWDANAVQTLEEWSQPGPFGGPGSFFRFIYRLRVGDVCASGDKEVSSGWADTNCGVAFGDTAALTRVTYEVTELDSGPYVTILDADVLINSNLNWDVYDGPVRVDGDGKTIHDFRREVLHQYGHVLGLGHPDLAGQSVVAVMNSTFSPGSDTDRLTADDKNGAIALYRSPGGPIGPDCGWQFGWSGGPSKDPRCKRSTSSSSSSSGGSSSFDAGLIALILLVFVLRARGRRKSRKQRSSVIDV